jgi:SAM-dependent methyltransferase
MYSVPDVEAFFRAFHAGRPGVTTRALARAGSYERLAARLPREGRVLDLACGDDHLITLIGARAVGIDLAPSVLDGRPSARLVRGRAQSLPFRDGAFSAVTCHLAFMLFDDVEGVVAELARVLEPGGQFLALVGGGPTAEGSEETDAFQAFASLLYANDSTARGFGDRRASTETGWCELFAGWTGDRFERWELDLSGSFDDVWSFLGASYQLKATDAAAVRDRLRARFPGERVPCRVATYFARAIKR